MRILHIIDRVIAALLHQQIKIDINCAVYRVADQFVTCRIHTHSLYKVFKGDDITGALRHTHVFAVLDKVHQLPNHDLNLLGPVPQDLSDSLESSHVAAMVCTKHIDGYVRRVLRTGHFIAEIRNISSNIGVITIRFNDHPVFIIAVIGGAHPPRALGFKKLTILFHLLNDAVGLARFKYRVFVEEDIKVGTETVQRLFNLCEHKLGSDFTENFCGVFGVERVWALGENLIFDIGNIGARIAVFRGRLSLGCSKKRVYEPINLSAVIVEVVFAHHICALGFEDIGERIAHGRPAGSTQVDGAGGVSRDEFKVNGFSREFIAGSVCFSSFDDGGGEGACRSRIQGYIEEAWTGNIYR